jgi:predicted cobalt transporter CbtA
MRRSARQRVGGVWLVSLLWTVILLVTKPTLACSVCAGSDPEEVRSAFIVTTAFMTFFPLLMIGGVIYWLRRRFRQLASESSDLSRSAASH